MSRTVTAFFDNRAEAEQARQRLTQANIDIDRVRIIDKTGGGSSSMGSSSGSTGDGGGFWASLKDAFLPDEDRHAYGEGISRGGYLLCAQVEENEADEAIRILDSDDAVDFDQRQDQWRSEGWGGYDRDASTAGSGLGLGSMGGGSGMTGTSQTSGLTGGTQTGGLTGTDRTSTVAEEHIPIVEEELRIGKREVNRGGARVRSYVREIPVHEQVSLREEHVSVERRPVDERISPTDLNSGDLLRDRTIEMTETAEEAVVAKEARVTEEVVVRKTAEEHVEQIDDTVRRTEVDVDEGLRTGNESLRTGGEDRSAFFNDGENRGGSSSGGGLTGGGTTGTGATGYDSKDPTPAGTGYSDRIDKSGL